MLAREIKSQLANMKMHLDQMDDFVRQTMDMVYELEEKILDYEESLIDYQRKSLKGAATHNVSPPRLRIDHCSKDNIALAAFTQEFQYLNALIGKGS